MAILKCRSGEVEVQLRKPRIEDDVPNYFEEFENVRASIGSTSANRCTKYIISEDTSYTVEVTLKKGFDFGEAEGVRVKLYDKASDNFIGQKAIDKGNVAKLADDHTVLIETVSGGIFDGHWVKDAELMFKALSMGMMMCKIPKSMSLTLDRRKTGQGNRCSRGFCCRSWWPLYSGV